MTALLLLVYALAVARVTGLVVSDTITEPLRDKIVVALDDQPGTAGAWFSALITCPWCASVWMAAVAAPLVWFWGEHPVMLVPALALAFSQVAGMTASVGR